MKSAYVYLTDERGLALTRFSIVAAMLTQAEDLEFVLFCAGFRLNKNDSLMNAATKLGRSLDVHYLDRIKGDPTNTHVTSTATLKVNGLDFLSKNYDRLLYLDSDVLLFDEFGVNSIDFEGYSIAAVYDIAECGGMTDPEFLANCGINGCSPHYFNAGVIAIDCAKWRSDFLVAYRQIEEKHRYACPYKNSCRCVDQCIWNLMFERNWKRLPLYFNFQACAIFSKSWKYSIVRHYVGAKKFWPLNPFRNDARDIALLNRCASILGNTIDSKWWYPLARWLNNIRNRRYNSIVLNAISYVEDLYAKEM
jgi:lipopolysaccharide biosynthesis glycosyltransferase